MLSKQQRIAQRKAEAKLRKRMIQEKSANILVKSNIDLVKADIGTAFLNSPHWKQANMSGLTLGSQVVEKFREASKGKYVRWRNVNGRVNID